jgi:DNA-binding transcriptional MerR regulator
MDGYRIGELARAAGVAVDTVRHYERIGLIPTPPRTTGGYRRYPADVLPRLLMIRRTKEFGFSLSEIGCLLGMLTHREAPCRHVHGHMIAKLEELEARISELSRIKQDLQSLAMNCDGSSLLHQCPVLKYLGFGGDVAQPGSTGKR